MIAAGTSRDLEEVLNPILLKYHGRKFPLDYNNLYELLVMVILSAQTSDEQINKIAPALFKAFPNIKCLATANFEELSPYIKTVRNFYRKGNWLLEIANKIKIDEAIPTTMDGLLGLKGIGRKSANVILREMKLPAEGIFVDLHVIRVVSRIGIIKVLNDGITAEKQLMQSLPINIWGEVGFALSFLGRDICRPKPNCPLCPIKKDCDYYNKNYFPSLQQSS